MPQTHDDARRLGLTETTVASVRAQLQREKIPLDDLDAWTAELAASWRESHGYALPHHPRGLLLSWARRKHAEARKRRLADARGATLAEDRKRLLHAYHQALHHHLDRLTSLHPAPPIERPPHYGQLYSAFQAWLARTARLAALDEMVASDDPALAPLAGRILDERDREAREHARTAPPPTDPELRVQARLDRWLAGRLTDLDPAPKPEPREISLQKPLQDAIPPPDEPF